MPGNYESGVYSFQDVVCTIIGPNINMIVTGTAQEGYSVEFEGDKNTVTMGAGGDGMTSLRAAQNGVVMIRMLKTSSFNQGLGNAYNFQTASAANSGRNRILIEDPVRGDTFICQGCSFKKLPTVSFAEIGGTQDWAFNAIRITPNFGAGVDTQFNG